MSWHLPPWQSRMVQSVGAVGGGGGEDGMDVDGGGALPSKRTLYVGTHAMSIRRDGMEVSGDRPQLCRAVPLPLPLPRWLPGAAVADAGCLRWHSQVVTPFQDGMLADWEVAEGLLDHALK